MAKLELEIQEDLETELQLTEPADSDILSSKVKNAIREIKRERNYQPHHTEEFIEIDIQKYYSNIRELALYDFNQVGAEGQVSMSENGVSRSWKSRRECFNGVIPFAKVV